MGDEELCNTRLGLGLCSGEFRPSLDRPKKDKPSVLLNLSFPLIPKLKVSNAERKAGGSSLRILSEGDDGYENKSSTASNNNGDDNQLTGSSTRKKLRLSKEQSTLLEDSFKQHTTLNQAQKQTLAEKLNLRPRQVEVWFQNRRARTKLKQTEVDCENLKKCCDSLTDENRRLRKELQELQSLKLGPSQPLYIQLPKAATLAVCPACQTTIKNTSERKSTRIFDVVLKANKMDSYDEAI